MVYKLFLNLLICLIKKRSIVYYKLCTSCLEMHRARLRNVVNFNFKLLPYCFIYTLMCDKYSFLRQLSIVAK